MTHTLHRVGTEESLSEDYVVLVMPSKDINHEGSGSKMRRFFEMALEAGAIKIGDARLGNEYHQGGVEKVIENVQDRAVVHAVFKQKDSLINVLVALKEADLVFLWWFRDFSIRWGSVAVMWDLRNTRLINPWDAGAGRISCHRERSCSSIPCVGMVW